MAKDKPDISEDLKRAIMHPYQDQLNRLGNFIKLRNRAIHEGFWLEVIDLTYVLLELELRLLLTSEAGKQGKPLSRMKIDKQRYLSDLAKLAKDNEFINSILWKQIADFNKRRRDAIHGLAQGRISYSELKDVCSDTSTIIFDIQSCWLPLSYGKIDTFKEWRNKNNA